jgi:hypothetical protein
MVVYEQKKNALPAACFCRRQVGFAFLGALPVANRHINQSAR